MFEALPMIWKFIFFLMSHFQLLMLSTTKAAMRLQQYYHSNLVGLKLLQLEIEI